MTASPVKFSLAGSDILLTQCEICSKGHVVVSLRDDLNRKMEFRICAEFHFSFPFSKKIYHRRSLYHTPPGVYHRFAEQIYITVGCAYPYAHPTKGVFYSPGALLVSMVNTIFRVPGFFIWVVFSPKTRTLFRSFLLGSHCARPWPLGSPVRTKLHR